jgi:hypothetical protein
MPCISNATSSALLRTRKGCQIDLRLKRCTSRWNAGFEDVVARCILEGVVGGENFATDASLIQADANKQNSTAKEDWDLASINPETASKAVVEYLFALDDEAFGAATEVTPKFTSHSDPSSQWTAAHHGPAFFAYSNNKIVSAKRSFSSTQTTRSPPLAHANMRCRAAVDVQASRSVRTGEVHATRRMIERVQHRFGLWPERLIADTAYGSGEMLGWLVNERGIEPHIPVIVKSNQSERTEHSRVKILLLITKPMLTSAPLEKNCGRAGGNSRPHEMSRKTSVSSSIMRKKPNAMHAI